MGEPPSLAGAFHATNAPVLPDGRAPGLRGGLGTVAVVRPIALVKLPKRTASVNHIPPSAPAVMPIAFTPLGLTSRSLVIVPAVVIRPIANTARSTNHNAPSEPR